MNIFKSLENVNAGVNEISLGRGMDTKSAEGANLEAIVDQQARMARLDTDCRDLTLIESEFYPHQPCLYCESLSFQVHEKVFLGGTLCEMVCIRCKTVRMQTFPCWSRISHRQTLNSGTSGVIEFT